MKATKKAILERLREIRDSYDNGQALVGPDLAFVSEILSHHPGSDDWEDPMTIEKYTVDWTKVEVAPGQYRTPNRSFHLHYASGNVWPFGWGHCVRAMSKAEVEEFTGRW